MDEAVDIGAREDVSTERTDTQNSPVQSAASGTVDEAETLDTPSAMVVDASLPAAPRAKRPQLLARRFPRGLSLLLLVSALSLGALAYSAELTLEHGDWADGVVIASKAYFALAVVTLLGAIIRAIGGRRSLRSLATSLAVTLLLLAIGAGSFASASPLHASQAAQLEHQHLYEAALHEYALAGERPPQAPNLARVYDEWGEQLLAQDNYTAALDRFSLVVTDYAQSGSATARAQRGLVNTYVAWVLSGATDIPYGDAIAAMASYRTSAACDASCETSISTAEAQARYQYGSQLAAQHDYAGAVTQFEVVQTTFPTSVYTKQAHSGAAAAYYSIGQAQRGSACADAVKTFRTLSATYADTPEGGKATSALAAPVDVSGTLTRYPGFPLPTLHLSKSIDPSRYFFSDEYSTALEPATGHFTFKGVAQGNYNLSTSRVLPVTNEYEYFTANDSHDPYAVHAGPLCPVLLGTITY